MREAWPVSCAPTTTIPSDLARGSSFGLSSRCLTDAAAFWLALEKGTDGPAEIDARLDEISLETDYQAECY